MDSKKCKQLAQKTLESYAYAKLYTEAYSINQKLNDVSNDVDIEFLFRNRPIKERTNAEERIIVNNRLFSYIYEVLSTMLKKDNTNETKLYIRILVDSYIRSQHLTADQVAATNKISTRTLSRKKAKALEMFGECLVELYGYNLSEDQEKE